MTNRITVDELLQTVVAEFDNEEDAINDVHAEICIRGLKHVNEKCQVLIAKKLLRNYGIPEDQLDEQLDDLLVMAKLSRNE